MSRIPVPPGAPVPSRSAPWLPRHASAAARLLLLPLAAIAALAQAIGLGEVSQQSALGAPLRVVVPVIAGTAEELAGECVRIVAGDRSADGIPEVRDARIALERTAAGVRIVVTAPRAVSDPVLKLTLQAGCDSVVRREYVLLMDPVPIDAPVAQESGQRDGAAAGAATRAAASAGIEAAAGATGAPTAPAVAGTPPRRRAAPAARARAPGPAAASPRARAPGPARARAAAPAVRTPAAAPPKLTVSTAAPAPGASATPADTTAALDAEAAALQQRVVELTAMVDRMQQEMRAAEARQTAQAAADNAARTGPQATLERWRSEGWPLIVAVVALAVMIAALLSYRRRRAAAAGSGAWRMEAPSPGPADPPAPAPAPRPAPIAAAAAVAATRPQVTGAPGAASTVDVSELSHVTEEAGVYLAFNRPDRAIDVLREHIAAAPRSLPAAWLMLLDLYHAQGREQEFRELAAGFHRQFNAQAPSWDAYRPQAQDDRGLEAFPHIVGQLTAIWGKPACREFLDHLLHENRDGRRSGFSLAAYEDILFLRQLADAAPGGVPAARTAPGAAVRAAAAARPAGPAAAAPGPATRRRAPTLDLELALDEDMLDAGKPPGAAAPPPAGDPPKRR